MQKQYKRYFGKNWSFSTQDLFRKGIVACTVAKLNIPGMFNVNKLFAENRKIEIY